MQVYETFLDAMGNTPLVRLHSVTRGVRPTVLAKLRDDEPRRIREGPDRDPDDRGGRARRPAEARRHDRRADLGQHRPRPRDRGGDQGLQVHLRDARQDEPGEDLPPARVRGRGRDHADRGRARVPRELLPRGRSARRRDPRRVPAEPVLQPREPEDPLRDHRPRDLGTDRRHGRRVRGGRGHRRHDQRRRPLPEGAEPGRPRRGRRPRGVALLGRRAPPLPRRGDRRGLLARDVRPVAWSTGTCG